MSANKSKSTRKTAGRGGRSSRAPVLRYEVRDEIAFVIMNRPQQLNALDGPLSDALRDTWIRFEQDRKAKVAILSGAGRAFCSGMDVSAPSEPGGMPHAVRAHQAYPKNGIEVFKPIVGAVRGYALGAGYWLAVGGCDITIASDNAQFGYPEPRVGVPVPPQEYIPYMPFKISLEFMLLAWKGGAIMDAQRALAAGLVNRVVADAELESEALRWAQMLKRIPPRYIKSIKRGHYRAVDTQVRRTERDFVDYLWPQEVSKDREEGMRAFAERREPRFTGL